MKSTLNTRDVKDLRAWLEVQTEDALSMRNEHAKAGNDGWQSYYNGRFVAYSDACNQIDKYLNGEITNFAYSARAEELRRVA